MIGGYYLGPAPGTRQAMFDPMPARSTAHYLDKVWAGVRPLNSAAVASIRAALAVWRPAAVVAVTSAGSPVGRVLIKLLGKPGFRGGGVLACGANRLGRRGNRPPGRRFRSAGGGPARG
jgi:hypothetical protein